MEKLKQKLLSNFNDIDVNIGKETQMIVNTKKEGVLALLSYLKNQGYDHLAMVSCSDWIAERELELIYIISPYLRNDLKKGESNAKNSIIIKTRISREQAKFITITDLFENAEPYEREMHEMFGVHFEGHSRLTPLMLERDYEIPPFRKDFNLLQYVDNTFGKIPTIEARKRAKI